MSKARIRLYLDVVSPWSFYAFKILDRYCKPGVWDIDMDIVPFFLGGVMQGTGNKPPITVPAKGAYMGIDMERTCQYYGIKSQRPSQFPLLTVKPQRLLCIIAEKDPSKLKESVERLYAAYWQDDKDVTDVAILSEYLSPVLGDDKVKAFLGELNSQAVKDKLSANTKEAMELGSFGSPWIAVKKAGDDSPFSKEDCYFGTDRFPMIAQNINKPWLGPFPEKEAKARM